MNKEDIFEKREKIAIETLKKLNIDKELIPLLQAMFKSFYVRGQLDAVKEVHKILK